jgi:hypothetical protein
MKDTSKDKVKENKDKESTAFVAKDHSGLNCHYCGIKGHIQPDYRKKKREEQHSSGSTNKKGQGGKGKGKPSSKGKKGKGKHHHNRHSNEGWNTSSSSDRSWNYSNDNAQWHTTHDKGTWTSTNKGKDSKRKGNGRGRGWHNGNFPSDYNGSYANIHQDTSHANETFDTYSQSQWTDSSSHNWVDSHDLGLMVLHNDNDKQIDSAPSTSEFYDTFARPHIMTPPTSALDMLPRYDYVRSHHPEIGTREDLPPIFQIHVHYEPYYAPFPVTVRSEMKIRDLITQLSYLFNTKRIFFFLFYDNRICLHRHRLQDVRGLVPSSTLLLVHWDDQDALYFHSFYNKLNATDTLDLYWNFTSRSFQRTHPAPTRQQSASPASLKATPATHASPASSFLRPASTEPAPQAISFAFMSIDSISNALQSSSISPLSAKKYYAVRRGRYPSPTIVDSWDTCKQLVHGFPNAEFKSFRTFPEATTYLKGADHSFICLHHDDRMEHLGRFKEDMESR